VQREVLRIEEGFHPVAVHRFGDIVIRDAGAWTPAVHVLLVGQAGRTTLRDDQIEVRCLGGGEYRPGADKRTRE
jgi:hypothetical protein